MINARKLLLDMLDYGDAGANRKHDPRGKAVVVGGKSAP